MTQTTAHSPVSTSIPPTAVRASLAVLSDKQRAVPVSALRPSAMRRISPAVAPSRTFESRDLRGELFVFDKFDNVEMEFSLGSHLIMLLPGGCEWGNGDRYGKLRPAPPNTIIFNPALEYLRIQLRNPQNQCRILLLTVEPAILNRLNDNGYEKANETPGRLVGIEDQTLRQALEAIQSEIHNPSVNSPFYVDTFLTLALNRLVQCASSEAVSHGKIYAKGGLPNWRLKRALKLLDDDFGKAPSLSQVAESVHLCPTSFCRAFKQSTGLSPHRYLLVHRIERAKIMMNDHDLSLTQIAIDCGFSSSSHFSVVFRRIMGDSPRKYRSAL